MIKFTLNDLLLIFGVVIAALAVMDLRSKWLRHCVAGTKQNRIRALFSHRWLRRLFGVRVAALLCGVLLSALEIWHEYEMHLVMYHR